MKIRYSVSISILLLTVLAAGCVKFDRPRLDRKYFVTLIKRTSPVFKGGNETLVVRRIKISPRYQDRELVYRTGKTTYEADYYNLFFVSPSEMLTGDLRKWLGDTKLFKNVIAPTNLATGRLVLEGFVNSLYGDYQGTQPQAVIEMQFFLVDNKESNTPIIYSRNFSERVNLKSEDCSDLVEGMSHGIEKIFRDLEIDLSTLAAVRPQKLD